MYELTEQATIHADLDAVWSAVTDVDGWPGWDPHEQQARLDGPFQPGTTGWSKPNGGPAAAWTITEVVPRRRWSSECPLPGGRLVGENLFEPLGNGQIRCTRTIRVSGPMVPLFRFFFGPRIRRDMAKTWAALEREAARRADAAPQ